MSGVDMVFEFNSDAVVVKLCDGDMTASLWALIEVGSPKGAALESSGYSSGDRLAACIETKDGMVSYDFHNLATRYPVLRTCTEMGDFMQAWLNCEVDPEDIPEGEKLYPEDMQELINE